MIANFEIPEEGLQLFLDEIAKIKADCEDGSVFTVKISLGIEKENTKVDILGYAPNYTVTVYPLRKEKDNAHTN